MQLHRWIAGILLLTQVGCHRLTPVQAPGAYVNARMPTRIWVTPLQGPELALDAPRVVSDTLYGFSLISGAVATFALADLERVRAKELWIGPTIALGLVGAAALVAIAVLVGGDEPTEPPLDEEDSVVPVW